MLILIEKNTKDDNLGKKYDIELDLATEMTLQTHCKSETKEMQSS